MHLCRLVWRLLRIPKLHSPFTLIISNIPGTESHDNSLTFNHRGRYFFKCNFTLKITLPDISHRPCRINCTREHATTIISLIFSTVSEFRSTYRVILKQTNFILERVHYIQSSTVSGTRLWICINRCFTRANARMCGRAVSCLIFKQHAPEVGLANVDRPHLESEAPDCKVIKNFAISICMFRVSYNFLTLYT